MIVPETKEKPWIDRQYTPEELENDPVILKFRNPQVPGAPNPAPLPVQVETEPDISENEPAARFAAESKPEEIGADWETADRLDTPYSPLNFDRAALNAERRYREMLEQVSKPSLSSHPPTNQWLKQPENLGMAGNELGAIARIGDARERAIAADKARMEAENRAGRVSAWLSPFVSLGRGALNLAKLPEDILYLLHSFSAKLAEMPAREKPDTALQRGEAALEAKERATESMFVKDPVTGEEFFNPQWVNFSNAAKLLANEIPSAAAMIAATAATKGLAAPAAAVKYGPWVSRAYRLGKYMIQPAAVINTARVAQGVHDDGIKYLMAQGQTYEQAAANSAPGAILAGVASSVTGSPMEAKIIEGFAKSMAGQPATAGIGRRILAMLKQFPIQGTKEAAQEVLEGIGEDVSKWLTFQPDITLRQVAQNMVGNAIGGAIVGGALGAALHSPVALQAAAKTDYMASIMEHIKISKMPEKKLIEQIQAQTDGGPALPTVSPDVLATLWQGLGEDPAEAAANRGLPEFMTALTAGTEIQLTPEAFVKMAKSGELDQVEMDLRAVHGEMTPREQDAYAKDKERLIEQVKAGREPDEAADPDFQYIREYFRSQLLQAGRSADIAGTESVLPAAALVNLARREGLDPRFLLETYAPTVTRPLPGEQGPIIKRALERIQAGESAAAVVEEEIQPGTPEGVQWWEEYFQKGYSNKSEKLKITETVNFKKWFGDSKIVDDKGKPLVVYHGIDPYFVGKSFNNRLRYYFAFDPEYAGSYANRYYNSVMPVYLSIKNPLDLTELGKKPKPSELFNVLKSKGIDLSERPKIHNYKPLEIEMERDFPNYLSTLLVMAGIHESIIDKGYDGIIYEEKGDFHEGGKVVVAFEPTQIKSAIGNTGSFDPNDPNILLQRGGDRFASKAEKNRYRARLRALNTDRAYFANKAKATKAEMEEDAAAFAAFEDELDRSVAGDITAGGRKGKKRGKTVEAEPLGFFQYQDLGEGQKRTQIGFLEKADLTTFVHENTHLIMRVFRDLAARPEATEQIKKDWNALLEFVGADPGAEKLTIEQEEKLATAGERYLMEGKAPSNALKDAFARIKGWLQAIYELLKFRRLDTRLNDDVRQVFDRIYASDEEIAQARAIANDRPLLTRAEDVGMTPGRFEAYTRIAEKRIQQAKERNDARILADLVKDRREFLESERERLTPEVEAELDADPVYQALDILSRGQLPDGTPIKLFKPSLVEQFGEKRVSDLPRSVRYEYKIKGPGSIDADGAAALLGFKSGEALIDALAGAEKREVAVKRLVDARVKELHGDPLDPAKLAEDAQAALHETEPEDKLIELRELERARRSSGPAVRQAAKEAREEEKAKAEQEIQGERTRRKAEDFWLRGVAFEVPPLQAFRDAAKEIIRGGTRGLDLNPNKYLNAQRKYSAEAFRALASKDYEKAANAKQKELLNHYLYREAAKALEEQKDADKYVKTLMKPSIQKKIAQAGGDDGERVYLAQIWNILDKFQWTKESKVFLDTRAIVRSDIRSWLELEQEKGEISDSIDPEIFSDETKNYRELTPDELSGVVDSLKVIHAAARRQAKALRDQKETDYEENVNWLVDQAHQNFETKNIPRSGTETDIQKAVSLVKQLDSSMRKIEQWVDRLDGGDINGPWRRLIFEPAAMAQYKEYQLYRDQVELIVGALEKMPKEIRKNLDEVIDLPGIGQVTRGWLISAALNTGNFGKNSNYEKLLKGEGLADPGGTEAFGKALERLTGGEWDFIQNVWDALATLKPEIEAQALRLDGIAPKWVDVQPFTVTLPDGTSKRLKGGYYPVVYDPLRSNAGKRQADAVFDQQTQRVNYPSTFQGYKKTRVEFARPFLLDFEAVLSRHLPKVIKDISHREAVLSIAKLLSSERVQTALNESIGPEYGAQFWNWLLNLVNDSAGVNDPSVSAWRRLLSTGRQNMVAATLGFRASSAVVQLSDWSRVLVGAHAVKPQHLLKSISRFSAQFAEYVATGGRSGFPMLEEMRAVSPEMLSRSENLDRDVRGAIKRLTFENSWLTTAQRWGFKGLAIADALTSTTTWWAAYDQATAEGHDSKTSVEMANRVVRLKLMTGAPKDIAPIQAAGDMGLKFVTMFLGDAINTYGIATEALANLKNRKAIASSAFALLMVGMIAPILADILKNKIPEDDEELKRYLAGKAIFGLPSSVPVLRDAVGAMQGGFDYKYTPVQTIIEKAIKTGKMGFDLVEGEKDVDWDDFFVTGLESAGMLAGIPGVGQVGTSYRFLDSLEEGRIEEPGSKLGYTRGLLFGPPPKPKGGR